MTRLQNLDAQDLEFQNLAYEALKMMMQDAPPKLQNLSETQGTNIKEFEAKAGSETMFDYNNGDPLANTDITDMHMQKGAAIDFSGASGKQEVAVLDTFQKGSASRAKDAIASGNMDASGTALDDQWATFDRRAEAQDHAMADAGFKVLLLI